MNTSSPLNLLREARTGLKLSLSEVAQKMEGLGRKCSYNLIHYWEKGERRPYPDDLRALGQILNLSAAQVDALVQHVETSRQGSYLGRRGARQQVAA